eukprot:8871878-Prorocentrum_lima.AAC.1
MFELGLIQLQLFPKAFPFLDVPVLQTWLASIAMVLKTAPCGPSPWNHEALGKFLTGLERL